MIIAAIAVTLAALFAWHIAAIRAHNRAIDRSIAADRAITAQLASAEAAKRAEANRWARDWAGRPIGRLGGAAR